MDMLADQSVDLAVTSPPYPMIQMWDDLFSGMSGDIGECLEKEEGGRAFELMHLELDKVWRELYRVTKEGSFVCINIGDAVRTLGGSFQLYSNHARIILAMKALGFTTLPVILWRKQTNAPNKFMGSGMLPAGAYVTLEHEYILIFRKGGKRKFPGDADKKKRMESAFFWEERNTWFSDVWDFKGTAQGLNQKELRGRSAAYPFELAYRLINMYSLKEDVVLDPFLGTGTTARAAVACGRNSRGIEIDGNFCRSVFSDLEALRDAAQTRIRARVGAHKDFITGYVERKGTPKHINVPHGLPVITNQETGLVLHELVDLIRVDDCTVKGVYKPFGALDGERTLPVSDPSPVGGSVQPGLFE